VAAACAEVAGSVDTILREATGINMRTVAEVIAELQAFPPGAACAAIERENCGIVVYESNQRDADGFLNQVGFVETPLPNNNRESVGQG